MHLKQHPLKLVVLISGRGSNLRAIQSAIETGTLHAHIVCVCANKASAEGLAYATEHGLNTAVVTPQKGEERTTYDARLAKTVQPYSPDVIVLAGFMRILTSSFLSAFSCPILNIHPALLPKYPGLDTHARALSAGDAEHGVTVHWVTAELDAGPILAQAKLNIEEADTPDSLAARVLTLEHQLYPEVLRWFSEARIAMLKEGVVLKDGRPLSF
ncbi:MAG: phosphoribosylglycinamide formyltransferase [Pseudomonadota bacterium]